MNTEARLSRRETQIAERLAWGSSKKEIASDLYISPRTVENTARNIYVKVEVRSIGQLSAWWFCTRFKISPLLSPLMAVFFMVLMVVNEIKKDDRYIRTLRTKSVKSKQVINKKKCEGLLA